MNTRLNLIWLSLVIALPLSLTGQRAIGQQHPQSDAKSLFHQGYYLQYHEDDTAAALGLYEQALAANPTADIVDNIRQQIMSIQADVASSDFARLMPIDSIAYIEITDPAKHLEELLSIVGIASNSKAAATATSLPLEDGFVLPSNFRVDRDVLSCFQNVKGLGIAVTGMNARGEPDVLVAIHPGSGNPIRGLLKTALQVVPKAETLGSYPTYCHQEKIWLVETPSLILLSPRKELLEGAVKRISQPGDSLATLDSFQTAKSDRRNSFAFAFVDGTNAVKLASPHLNGEAAAARVLLDLDHLQHATAALHTTDSGIQAQVSVAYDEDHHSLAYNLIRTAPVSAASLRLVPNHALFAATMGINPKMAEMADGGVSSPGFSLLDLGRELFSNIEELSLFVMPHVAAAEKPVPDFGLIVVSNNPQKSENLWRQLLSLPAKLDNRAESKVTEFTLHGQPACRYHFAEQDVPEVILTRLTEHAMIVGTAKTVEEMLNGSSADERGAFADGFQQLPDHVSKAAFVNLSQALYLAGQMAPPSERQQLLRIGELCRDTRLALTSDEAPATWSIRLDATGIPQIPDVVKAVADSMDHQQSTRSVKTQRPE